MDKNKIENEDILFFANGEIVVYSLNQRWILDMFYNDNLECIGNPNLNIVKIIRQNDQVIYTNEQNITRV